MKKYSFSSPYGNHLREITDSLDRLRPLPSTATRVLSATEDPTMPADMIGEMLSLDQALTIEVLKFANSAQMGYLSDCSSIETAVVRLGFKRIRALVLKSFASGPLNRRLNGYRLGADALWQHSLSTATFAEKIARAVSYAHPEDAYVAGLLHDIGKLILDQFIIKDYHQITNIMKSQNKHVWEVEEKLFGIDHAGVGGLMAEKWKLPRNLINSIRYHHLPTLARTHRELAAIINIANSFTPKDTTSLTGLDGRFVNPTSLEILNLNLKKIDQMWESFSRKTQPTGRGV